jgi:hypothetical protein
MADETQTEDPTFTVTLPDKRSKRFEGFAEVRDWAEGNRKTWQDRQDALRGHLAPHANQALQELVNFFKGLTDDAELGRRAVKEGSGAALDQENRLRAGLLEIERGRYHDNDSPVGLLCGNYVDSDKDLAAAFAIMAAPRNADGGGAMKAPALTSQKLIEAALVSEGGEVGLKARAEALEAMALDYGKKFEARLTGLDATVRDYDQRLAEAATRQNQNEDETATLWESARSDLGALKAAYEADIKTLKATYKETLHLEAPASYWAKKKTVHAWLYWCSGGAFLSAIAGIGYAAWSWRAEIVAFLPRSVGDELGLSALVFFTVPALFIAWGLRVVVRLFNENLAQAGDAMMRATMITTYLALTKESAATDEERVLILNAIFRAQGASSAEDNLPDIAEIIRQARSGAH